MASEKRQGGRTGIPHRKLRLKTRENIIGIWIWIAAHVHRIGNNEAWMRSGQVLREIKYICIEQDGASPFQWRLS